MADKPADLKDAALMEREGAGTLSRDGVAILFNGEEIARFETEEMAENALRIARKRYSE